MKWFMYHESILFTQPFTKIAKMNLFAVLESQDRLSTSIKLNFIINAENLYNNLHVTSALAFCIFVTFFYRILKLFRTVDFWAECRKLCCELLNSFRRGANVLIAPILPNTTSFLLYKILHAWHCRDWRHGHHMVNILCCSHFSLRGCANPAISCRWNFHATS